MNIGEASRASGVSAKMIRYYEETGLIPPAGRSGSGYRTYGPKDVQTLRFIRRARDLGFPMDKVADLLALWHDRSRASADVKLLARQQADALEARIREMQEMKATLDHLVHACAGDNRPDCPILADLGGTRAQVFDHPPSITCATPVVKLDSSDAR
jgi:Cu(I)-responsive transcriptional regulator